MDFFEIRQWIFTRMRVGLRNMTQSKNKRIIFCILICILIGIFISQNVVWHYIETNNWGKLGYVSAYMLLCIFLISGTLLLFGNVFEAWRIHKSLLQLGMHNHLKEVPIFLYKNTFDKIFFSMYFYSPGIPMEEWERKKYGLENIFNVTISKIIIEEKMNQIVIHGMKGINDFTPIYVWNNQCTLTDKSILQAGQGMHGIIEIPLNVYPHILIGGTTGSGKTWLLKVLLFQAVQLDYDVMIADFKGGVDFTKEWKEKCIFIEDIPSLIIQLQKLLIELDLRKRLLVEAECSNIDELNQLEEFNLKRIIFACDEIAELFDTAGMDKEQKEQKKKIEGMISTIARLGRAFGIHLILSTQRPDADIVPGQIKNNIPYRICGRADSILSKIILDNTDAAELIPSDIQGVFLNQKGELFKGYYLLDKL